ncbi:MAG: hypothetical protein V4642_05940 [Bacteroidota bacterium]
MENLLYTFETNNVKEMQQFAAKAQKVRFRETGDKDLVRRFQQQLKKATLLNVGLIQAM